MNKPKRPLKVLIIEDNPDDADLVLSALRRSGYEPVWNRVETRAGFLSEVKNSPDIILSDYALPQFSGLDALKLLRETGLDVPFILISGTIGEDIAVEAMQMGAADYLLKDRTVRLGAAVKRALEEKQLRNERQRVDKSLNLFRTLVDRSSDGIDVVDPDTAQFLDVNNTTCERLGYTRQELLAMRVIDIEVDGVAFTSWTKFVEELRLAGNKVMEGRQKRKDGSAFPVEVRVRLLKLDREYIIASVRDITDRKRVEEEMKSQLQELQRWHEAMLGREDRILELKGEVNELLKQLRQPPRYTNTNAP